MKPHTPPLSLTEKELNVLGSAFLDRAQAAITANNYPAVAAWNDAYRMLENARSESFTRRLDKALAAAVKRNNARLAPLQKT